MNPAESLALHRAVDPIQSPWGCYLAPASGEGDGLLWFDSARELYAFLDGPLWEALAGVGGDPEALQALAGLFQGAPLPTWALLEQANHWLEPVAQIHWWGSLRQLYEGEDPFARDLREAWRQGVGRGPQDFSALAAQDQQDFVGFLKDAFR